MKKTLQLTLLVLGLGAGGAQAGDNPFCGGPAARGDAAAGRAQVVGDQSVEYAVNSPASIGVCSAGYEAAKCGDYDSAFKIFDKCIAAGYVRSMIWKASALEDGAGGRTPDLAAATELMRRVAISDSPYAATGKLYYARALFQGKGVARDEAAAHKWLEAAASDGEEEAIRLLRSGQAH